MRNIETFPSKQMYPYLSLVERRLTEFNLNIDRKHWLVWLKWLIFITFSRQLMVSLVCPRWWWWYKMMVVTQQMIGTVKSFSKLSKSFSSYSKVGIISGPQTVCSKQYSYRHKGLKLACNTKLNRPGPIKSVNIYWHTGCRRISWHWQSTVDGYRVTTSLYL